MGAEAFIAELSEFGFDPQPHGEYVTFDYGIEVGPLAGETIKMALQPPPDWPASPPSGPRVCPRLLPIHPDQSVPHPVGGVHEANELGPDWQYWSRPCSYWATTERSVRVYLGHLRALFDTLPDELQCGSDN